jgi:hypothetical protein
MSSIDGLSLEEAAKLSIALEGATKYCKLIMYTHFTNDDGYEVALFRVGTDIIQSWYLSKSLISFWTAHRHTDQELKPITNLLKE